MSVDGKIKLLPKHEVILEEDDEEWDPDDENSDSSDDDCTYTSDDSDSDWCTTVTVIFWCNKRLSDYSGKKLRSVIFSESKQKYDQKNHDDD